MSVAAPWRVVALALLLAALLPGTGRAQADLGGPGTIELGRRATYELVLTGDRKVDACDVAVQFDLDAKLRAIGEPTSDLPGDHRLPAGATHRFQIQVEAVAAGDGELCATVSHRTCSQRPAVTAEKPVCLPLHIVPPPVSFTSIQCGTRPIVIPANPQGRFEPTEWADVTPTVLPLGSLGNPVALYLKTNGKDLFVAIDVPIRNDLNNEVDLYFNVDNSGGNPEAPDRRFRVTWAGAGTEFQGRNAGYTLGLPTPNFVWEVDRATPPRMIVEMQIPLTEVGGPAHAQAAAIAVSGGGGAPYWPTAFNGVQEQFMEPAELPQCERYVIPCGSVPTVTQGAVPGVITLAEWNDALRIDVQTPILAQAYLKTANQYLYAMLHVQTAPAPGDRTAIYVNSDDTATSPFFPTAIDRRFRVQTPILFNEDVGSGTAGGYSIPVAGTFNWEMRDSIPTREYWVEYEIPLSSIAGPQPPSQLVKMAIAVSQNANAWPVAFDQVLEQLMSNFEIRDCSCGAGGFSWDPAHGCTGSPIQFTDLSTNIPISWAWDFGDGSPIDTTQNPLHTFASPGTYNVTLTANSAGATCQAASHLVIVTTPPIAALTAIPTTVCIDAAVATVIDLDASASAPVGAPIIDPGSFSWSMLPPLGALGGGISATETLTVPAGSWGTTAVTVLVTDVVGCSDSAAQTIILHGSPIAALVADRTAFCTDPINPMDVALDASGTLFPDGPASTWVWALGIGAQIGAGANIIWRIPAATTGVYIASVEATDSNGCKHQASVQIEIYETPRPSFVIQPQATTCTADTGTLALTLNATASAPGGGATLPNPGAYAWSMAPPVGSLGGSTGPIETLTVPAGVWGTTTVTLDLDDSHTCRDQTAQIVTIHGRPTALLVADRLAFCTDPLNPMDVAIDASGTVFPDGPAAAWLWTLGVGSQVGIGPTILWRIPAGTTGIYIATIDVTDANGCSHQASVSIEIYELPQPSFVVLPQATMCTAATGSLLLTLDGNASVAGSGATLPNPGGYTWSMAPPLGALGGSTGPAETLTIAAGVWGTTTVTLDLDDTHTCRDSTDQVVTVHGRPTAVLAADRVAFCTDPLNPMDVALDASGTLFPDGPAATWTWNLGVGGPLGTGPIIVWRIPPGTTGIYTASVDVTDANGCTHQASVQIEIFELPTPSFVILPQATLCNDPAVATVMTLDATASAAGTGAVLADPGGYLWSAAPAIGTLGGSTGSIETFTLAPGVWGTTTVTVGVTDTHTCSAPTSEVLTVHGRPTAALTADRLAFCTAPLNPMDVALDASGTVFPDGPAATWTWTLGVGAQVGIGPTITWRIPPATTGVYTATVDVTDANGCIHQASVQIEIYELPTPSFAVLPQATRCNDPAVPTVMTFNATASTAGTGAVLADPGGYLWSAAPAIGTLGGGTGSIETLTLAPGVWGATTVTVDVTDTHTCSEQTSQVLTVHGRPTAALTADRLAFCTDPVNPMDVALDASATLFPDGPAATWAWNLGVGGPVGTGPTIVWRIPPGTTGVYTATIDVTDTNGCIHQASVQIEIYELPTPSFVVLPQATLCNDPAATTVMTLNATASTAGTGAVLADPGGYLWSAAPVVGTLGGSTGSIETLTFAPGVWGTSTVTLAVTDTHACSDRTDQIVTVHGQPTAALSADRLAFCTDPQNPMDVALDASATLFPDGPAATWTWTLGVGGQVGIGPVIIWRIPPATTGVYTATIDVTDANGCTHQASVQIEIFSLPGPSFLALPQSSICIDPAQATVITFDATATTPGSSATVPDPGGYLWSMIPSLGVLGGSTGSFETLTAAAGLWGTTQVTVEVTNTNNCADRITQPIALHAPPLPAVLVTPDWLCSDPVNLQSVTLDATATGFPDGGPNVWSWTGPPGLPIPDLTPVAIWQIPAGTVGPQTATVTVGDLFACSATGSAVLDVLPSPTAILNASATTMCGDPANSVTVQLDASSSLIPGSGPATWNWITPPGLPVFGTGPVVDWTFPPATTGTYTATVVVTDASGCAHAASVAVTVLAGAGAVVAPIAIPCHSTTAPIPVNLDGTGSITTAPAVLVGYDWAITGPAVPASGTSPTLTVTYPAGTTGSYIATLTVTSSSGCTATTNVAIDLDLGLAPMADLVAPLVTCTDTVPVVLALDASASTAIPPRTITGYTWSAVPGTVGGSAGPVETVTVPAGYSGTVVVQVTVIDSAGCIDQATVAIEMIGAPTALASATPLEQCEGTPSTVFSLTAVGTSQHPSDPTLTYAWTTTDGTLTSPTTAATDFDVPTLNLSRSVAATLTVTDAAGCVSLPIVTTLQVNANPTVTMGIGAAVVGLPTTFTSAPVNGTPPYSLAWTFGDGGTGNGASPTHVYTLLGVYAVGLTVTDQKGCSATITQSVTVASDLAGTLTATDVCRESLTTLTASVTGGVAPLSYLWDFGDGASQTTVVPATQHLYAVAGTFAAAVTVLDAGGTTIVLTANVVVHPLPSLSLQTNGPALVGSPQVFAATTGPGVTLTWAFADGFTAVGASVTRTFTAPQNVHANVTATTSYGCTALDSIDLTIVAGTTEIQLSKTVAPFQVTPGGDVEYTVFLANGHGVLLDVMFEDQLPNGFLYLPGTLTTDAGNLPDPGDFSHLVIGPLSLAPDSSLRIHYRVRVDSGVLPGTYDNSVVVRGVDAGGRPLSAGPRIAQVGVIEAATGVDLRIRKSAQPDPEPAAAGGLIRYTLDYENVGATPATHVQLRDMLPPEHVTVVDNPDFGVLAARSITWTLDLVPPRASGRLRYTLRIDADVPTNTVLRNVVVIGADEPDVFPADNKAIVDIPLGGRPDLVVSKAVMTVVDPAQPGGEVSYTLEWKNQGTGPATSAVVDDDYDESRIEIINLPAGTSDVGGVLHFQLGDVLPGQSGTLVYHARVRDNASGVVDNTARISSSSPDVNPANNVAKARFTVVQNPARLELQAEVDPGERCRRPQVEVALRSDRFDTAEAMSAAATLLQAVRTLDRRATTASLVEVNLIPQLRSRLQTIAHSNVLALFQGSGMGRSLDVAQAPDRVAALPTPWLHLPISLPFDSAHPTVDRDQASTPWCQHDEHRRYSPQAIGHSMRAIATYLDDVAATLSEVEQHRALVLRWQALQMIAALSDLVAPHNGTAGPLPAFWTVGKSADGSDSVVAATDSATTGAVATLVAGLASLATSTGAGDDLQASTRAVLEPLMATLDADVRGSQSGGATTAVTLIDAARGVARLGFPRPTWEAAATRLGTADPAADAAADTPPNLRDELFALLAAVRLGDTASATATWKRLEQDYLEAAFGVYRATPTGSAVDYTPSTLATGVAGLLELSTLVDESQRVEMSMRALTLLDRIAFDAGMQLGLDVGDGPSGSQALILGGDGEPAVTTVERSEQRTRAPVLVERIRFLGESGRHRDVAYADAGRGIGEDAAAIAYLADSTGTCRNAVVELTDRRLVTETASVAAAAIDVAGQTLLRLANTTADPRLIGAGQLLGATARADVATISHLSGMGIGLDDARGVDGSAVLARLTSWAGLDQVPAGLKPIWLELAGADPGPIVVAGREIAGWDRNRFDPTVDLAAIGRVLALEAQLSSDLAAADPATRFLAATRLHAAGLKLSHLVRETGKMRELASGWQPVLDAAGHSITMPAKADRASLRDVASLLDGVLACRALFDTLPAEVVTLASLDHGRDDADRLITLLMPLVEERVALGVNKEDPVGLWYTTKVFMRWSRHSPEVEVYARAVARQVADAILSTPHEAPSDLTRVAFALEAAVGVGHDREHIRTLYHELRDRFLDRSFRLFLPTAQADGATHRLTDLDAGAVIAALAAVAPALSGEESTEAVALLREVSSKMILDSGLQRSGRVASWPNGSYSMVPPHLAHAVTVRVVESPVSGSTVFPGDFAHVRVRLHNPQQGSIAGNTAAVFTLPAGFSHVSGSTRLDDLPGPDPVGSESLIFPIGRLAAGDHLELRFAIRAQPTVRPGTATWSVRGQGQSNPGAGALPIETAATNGSLVVEGFGRIVGEVRLDVDGDGRTSVDDPGVPSVTVLLDDGSARVTDVHGRFAIDSSLPASYVLRLHEESLPSWMGVDARSQVRVDVTPGQDAAAELLAVAHDMSTGVVFRDRDGNHRHDRGESLVAGVVVESASGKTSITDRRGRYRLAIGRADDRLGIASRQPYVEDTSDLWRQPTAGSAQGDAPQ